MTKQIVVRQDNQITKAERMALVGQAANGYAAQSPSSSTPASGPYSVQLNPP